MATDVRLPEHFYKMLASWNPEYLSISTKQTLASLAVNDFNEKLKKLSKTQLKSFDQKMIQRCKEWIAKGYLDKNARGFKKE